MLPVIEKLAAEEQSSERERAGQREVEQAVLVEEGERHGENSGFDRAQQILPERDAE